MVKLNPQKKRTESSKRWLRRQLKDPYVQKAQKEGYRSRAAYKLLELQEKYKFLKAYQVVVDLGAAPGGWTQVLVDLTKSSEEKPTVFGVDLTPISSLPGAIFLEGDFTKEETLSSLLTLCPERLDGVLSDMAPSSTGHPQTDHLKLMVLLEEALLFAQQTLKEGGFFVAKVFQGGTEKDLLLALKKDFMQVIHAKPPSSRKESREMYVVALGFKGNKDIDEKQGREL